MSERKKISGLERWELAEAFSTFSSCKETLNKVDWGDDSLGLDVDNVLRRMLSALHHQYTRPEVSTTVLEKLKIKPNGHLSCVQDAVEAMVQKVTTADLPESHIMSLSKMCSLLDLIGQHGINDVSI